MCSSSKNSEKYKLLKYCDNKDNQYCHYSHISSKDEKSENLLKYLARSCNFIQDRLVQIRVLIKKRIHGKGYKNTLSDRINLILSKLSKKDNLNLEKQFDRLSNKIENLERIEIKENLEKISSKLDYIKNQGGNSDLVFINQKLDEVLKKNLELTEKLISEEVIDKIAKRIIDSYNSSTQEILENLSLKTKEIERVVKTLEFDPDHPKPSEVRTEHLAESIEGLAKQVLEIQVEFRPIIQRINGLV